MTDLAFRLRAALWWLLPLAALAAAIGWETDWGRAVEKVPPSPEVVTPKPVETSLLPEYAIAGGVAARADTVQRTLFNPTRRPAPALAQDAAVQRMQRGQFALAGTTVMDGKGTAFLREIAGNKSRRVQAGETINGLLVAEVKPDRVKLTLGDESEELVLRVTTNPRATVQPAVAAAPQAPSAPGIVQTPAQPAPATAQGTAQTLAERRAAARAAQAAAANAPVAPPAAAATGAGQAAPVDPRWQQLDQAYRERAGARTK